MTSIVVVILDELINAVTQVGVIRKLEIACVAAAWWDHLIIFDDEVKYFWAAEWSPAKFLFLLNRYLVLVATTLLAAGHTSTTVNYPFCKFLLAFWELITNFAQVVVVQNIAILRLYALYGRSKKVLYTLVVLLVCCDGASIAVITIQSLKAQGTAMPFPGFHYCFVSSRVNILYLFWFPLFTFELVILAFTIYKIWTDFRSLLTIHRRNLSNGSDQRRGLGSRLVAVMLRDYLLYFIVITVLDGSSLALYSLKEATQAGLLNQPVVVITSILGTRLLLNIRVENDRATTKATTLGVTGEVIEFGARTSPSEGNQTEEPSAADV